MDVKFLFQPTEVTDGPEVAARSFVRMSSEVAEIPPDEQLPSPEMSETAICGYCGTEYVRTEGHKCIAGIAAGTVVRLSDEEWAIVLEATTETVIYFDIPKNAVEVHQVPAVEFQQRFL